MDKFSIKLKQELEAVPMVIDGKKKAASLTQIRKAAEDKRVFYRPSPVRILIGQIKYSMGSLMGVQCVFGILMFVFLHYMSPGENSMYDYLALLSAFAAFVNVFMMVEVSRIFSYQMAEIEQSCYWNLRQLCVCKMVGFGGTELILLSVLLAAAGKDMEIGIFRFGVYIMVPFLTANLIYLFVFTELRRAKREYTQYILAFLLGTAAAIPVQFPKVYEAANFGIWILLLFLAAGGLGYESLRMLKGMEEGEECWN